VWHPEWMRRRYERLINETKPEGLEASRAACREIWSWWDDGINVEIMEYWIRQVKYDISDAARRIIIIFWTHELEVGKSTVAKMLSAALEGYDYDEYKRQKNESLIGEHTLDNELMVASRFERPKSVERRSVVLNDIYQSHLRRYYHKITGMMEANTIQIERKGVDRSDGDILRNHPNYIITTNDEANGFMGKQKDRRAYGICWDNAIKVQKTEDELFNIVRNWVLSVYVPPEQLEDWQDNYYPHLKTLALQAMPDLEIEDIITQKKSEIFISEACKRRGSRFDIKDWIEKFFPSKKGENKREHRKRAVNAFVFFAPGCMKANPRGYYQFVDAKNILSVIQNEKTKKKEQK
ncbi:MAG: hypothetical protein LUG55_07450, partial [Clostridiales bacterium]|nr:hypothetical protein [Clostridiales bacterium]